MSRSFSVLVVCAAGALPACAEDGRQWGYSSNGDDGSVESLGVPRGPSCEVTEVEVEPSLVTALGFSAQAVLDLVVGEHTAALAWLDSEVEYGPESGRSELALAITASRAPLLVDRELAAGSEEVATLDPDFAGAPAPCRDSLRIPATVAVSTSSGALDEVVEVVFEAYEGDFAHGGFGVDLAALRGSFTATPVIPENSALTAATLSLELSFTEFGSSGALTLSSAFESADAIGVGTSGELAHFPADDYCGPTAVSVGAEQTVRGLSVSRALAALNAASGERVSYRAGGTSQLALDFSSAAELMCASFESSVYGNWAPGITTLDFVGAVQLTTADGRVDGSLPVRITTNNQSEAGTLFTSASAEVETTADPASAAALPAQFGIQDSIDVSEFDGVAVKFGTSVWGPSNATTTQGLLEVHGVDVAECVESPPQNLEPGIRAPCAGIQRRLVWSAGWGSDGD